MEKEQSNERYYVECRSYTHARRHPFVIGTVGGWHLPSPLTPTQLGVLLLSFLGLYVTRGIWGFFGAINILIMLGVPMFLTWSIRHMRMEGRAPIRMAAGYLTYLTHPRQGVIHGHANRDHRQVTMRKNYAYLMPLVYVDIYGNTYSGGNEE